MKTKPETRTLAQFKEAHYGPRGTARREKPEQGFEAFKPGVLLHDIAP